MKKLFYLLIAGVMMTMVSCGGSDDTKNDQSSQEQQNSEQVSENPNPDFEVNGVTFKMIKVEGGTFKMGAQNVEQKKRYYDKKAYDDESLLDNSLRKVELASYYIGETEVTQELWQTVMGNNPSKFRGPQRPVEQVSWNDCKEFITKLNKLTGKNFRLPTEAEWEYAARGGHKSVRKFKGYKYIYSGSNTLDSVAWYADNSALKTHNVKTKKENELGIYDMNGNVYEWCSDKYRNNSRVLRGGSYYSGERRCRVTNRSRYNQTGSFNGGGLRLVMSF